MKKFFRFLFKTLLAVLVLLALGLGSLFFRPLRLPASWTARLCAHLSSDRVVFHCAEVLFGFRDGLVARDIRLFDLGRRDRDQPVFSAQSVAVDPIRRVVTADRVRYPRLFESYYAPGYTSPADPSAPCGAFRFPQVGALRLVLKEPVILGVAPARVESEVSCTTNRLLFSQVHLDWPDQDHRMFLDGFCDVDLAAGNVRGEVRGTAVQAHIRPLLVALDVPSSYPYFDGFTEVPGPVRSYCGWDVDLGKNEFRLKLDLHPPMGRYNGVAMAHADGQLELLVQYGGRLDYHHTIGPISAATPKGGKLDGTVGIDGTNGVVHLNFDVRSTLPFGDLFAIADVFRHGEADFLEFETPPRGSLRGVLAPSLAHQADNNLRGEAAAAKARVFGVPLSDASCTWSYVGDRLAFENVKGVARDGGRVTGGVWCTFPGGDREKGRFGLDIGLDGGTLRELADVFKFDLGDHYGRVSGALSLGGPLSSNGVSRLNGRGHIAVRDGHLAQTRLFAGLTRLLAEKVPGIDVLVNQSQGSADFTVSNGVLRTANALIEGSVFAFVAEGAYDIAKDELDFRVRMQFLKDENFLSKLVHPIVWPFSKLFMEVELKGSLDDPDWSYVSVADRIPWPSFGFGNLLPSFEGER